MKTQLGLLAGLVALVSAAPASGQVTQSDSFVRVGAARLRLADEGKIAISGVVDPNADYETPTKLVASAELGHFFLEKVAVAVSATSPVTTSNIPAGSLAGLPNLGDDKFSIFALTATFHPLRGGVVSPYVGGGVALQKVWSTTDGLAANLRIDDSFGPIVQAGVDFNLSAGFGLFADAKKAFYTTKGSGDIGPMRITAEPELDPFLLQAGAVIRF